MAVLDVSAQLSMLDVAGDCEPALVESEVGPLDVIALLAPLQVSVDDPTVV